MDIRLTSFRSYRLATVMGSLIIVSGVGLADAAESISFSRDVQAILASRCLSCHGSDVAESNLSLNERDIALAAADSGLIPIVPGKPQQSELIRRISSPDDEERMPPEGEPLSERELQVLRLLAAGLSSTEVAQELIPIARRKTVV